MTRALLFLFASWILFTVFVTVFALSAPRTQVRALPKWLWVVICIFVPIVGGLLYLALGRPIGGPRRGFGIPRQVAPDDDPQFLRDLARRLEEEEKKDQPGDDEGDQGETKKDQQ